MESHIIDRIHYKQCVDSKQWKDIDEHLPDLPSTSLYNFIPKQQYKIYYQRLLYCLHEQQESQRAYYLTALILSLNTNNYYALMLRKSSQKLLWKPITSPIQLKTLLQNQLNFINKLLIHNPKQYQLWNYKKDLISEVFVTCPEIDKNIVEKQQEQFLLFMMMDDDYRNYHAWDYKIWLTYLCGTLQQKLHQTQKLFFLLTPTPSETQPSSSENLWANCYSCWSYRFNILTGLPEEKRFKYGQEDSGKTLKVIYQCPQNQCAWNYLTGLVETELVGSTEKLKIIQQIYGICKNVKEENRYAWLFLFQEALAKLMVIDPMRKLYYQYIKQMV